MTGPLAFEMTPADADCLIETIKESVAGELDYLSADQVRLLARLERFRHYLT